MPVKFVRAFATLSALCAVAFGAVSAGPAHAQAWPAKPVRLIVPFAPGGGTDAIARMVAQRMDATLGQPVIVENIGGAGGVIAAETVARAAPDGYTLLVGTESTHGTNSIRPLRYDPITQFAPVTLLATAPSLLVINPGVRANSLPELIAFAKSNPNKLNFGSWGNGSSTHLALEMFKAMSGAEISHIPYKGAAPSMTALIAGEVDVAFQGFTVTMPNLKAGRAKVIAVGGKKRLPLLPDVPTMSEAGVPGYEMQAWFAVFAPAGTPQPVIDRLQREMAQALAHPDVRDKLLGLGMDILASTPDVLRVTVANEVEKWKKLVRERNLTFD